MQTPGAEPGQRLVELLTERGETLASAESLTAGLVAATVADTPGASAVLLGGVVAYARRSRSTCSACPPHLIDRVGTVDPDVAVAMAEGARSRLGATWALATTGVAGPGPAEGKPPGTVHIAVAGPSGTATRALELKGDRAAVRSGTVRRGAAARAPRDRRHAPNPCAADRGWGYGRPSGSRMRPGRTRGS